MFIYPVTWVTSCLLRIAVHVSGCYLGLPCISHEWGILEWQSSQARRETGWLFYSKLEGTRTKVIITKGPPQDHQRPECGRILFLLTLQLRSVSSMAAFLSWPSFSPSPGIQQVLSCPLSPLGPPPTPWWKGYCSIIPNAQKRAWHYDRLRG